MNTKTKQELINDEWIFSYEYKNGLQVWCRKPRYEDIIQYVKWNPSTEEFLGLETVSYSTLKMFNSLYVSLEKYEI